MSDQRSVYLPMYNSCPPDFVNTWDQLHSNDKHDKTASINGLGTGQRLEGENSLGRIDRKWARSGSLSSRGSGFIHSSISKSMGVGFCVGKAEIQLGISPLQTFSGDAVACPTSAASSEETSSRKKPRLGWGEGLSKYEEKKVEGPGDSATIDGMAVCVNVDSSHSHASNLSNKSPRFTGLSGCSSSNSPSFVACSSSPGVESKPFVKAPTTDYDTNLCGSPSPLSRNNGHRIAIKLENLELSPISNLSSSIGELVQSDDFGSVDSNSVRSTFMNKLLVRKGDISNELEMTETEIDLLENELKWLITESGKSCPLIGPSNALPGECGAKPCEELVATFDVIPRLAPLQLVSSGDMIEEYVVCALEEENGQVRDENIDNGPGTKTSKSVESLSPAKASASLESRELPGDLDSSNCIIQEVKCLVYVSNEEVSEGLSASEGGGQQTASNFCTDPPVGLSINCDREVLYDLILASNKGSASRASEAFHNLLPSDQCCSDTLRKTCVSSWQNDPLIKEKFATRKRSLRFKERVLTLKFKAFQHLWKEDMRLLSIKSHRPKFRKRLELFSFAPHSGFQKHRSSIHSQFSSPAGNLSLVPTTEIIDFMSKLLSDSHFKLYSNSLKMPALILDKKEKMISRFISRNGIVEDPCAFENERAMINPWTTEEKDIFADKLVTFGKDFRQVASFLVHKTTADCIEFYYKNHKSDCFVKTKKEKECAEQGKSYSSSNYLVTSGKRWKCETNAASRSMLGAIADGAPGGDVGTLERSRRLDVFRNAGDTMAADVLAGICGTLSSETLSSSFDPGESYQDWSCPKTGSSKRLPLIPMVTRIVDNKICSDESCREMDTIDWTDEEKSIFIQAVLSYGRDFAMISRCVRTRSRDQCKAYFSKARKCLLLDMTCPMACNGGMPVNDNADGGVCENKDACVVETSLANCMGILGSQVDEDLMISGLSINHFTSDLTETTKVQTDLDRSEESYGAGGIHCEDPELQSENMVPGDRQVGGRPKLDCSGDSKMENGADSMIGTVQPPKIYVLPPHGSYEATGEGTLAGESLLINEDDEEYGLNDLEERNGEGDTSDPTDLNWSDQGFQAYSNTTHLSADTNASLKFGVSPKEVLKISPGLNYPVMHHIIAPKQDVSLVNATSVTKGPPASQYEKIRSDDQCQKPSTKDCSLQSALGHTDSCQLFSGYSMHAASKKEVNGDIGSKKLASFQSLSKVDRNFYSGMYTSREWFLQKCSSSKTPSPGSKLPFFSQGQGSDHSTAPSSQNSSDMHKRRRNGDMTLSDQILSRPFSHKKCTVVSPGYERRAVPHPKLSSKNFNRKFSGNGYNVPASLVRNNHLNLENGIPTGFSTLQGPNALTAKYPAAFGNFCSSSSNMGRQPLHSVVNSNKRYLNSVPVFSNKEMGSSTGVADYRYCRN